MCGSIHTNSSVQMKRPLVATRVIPMVIDIDDLDQTTGIAKLHYSIFKVKMFDPLKVRLIISGDELYKGRNRRFRL